MKKQDILENQAKTVLLSIGSNLGKRNLNIEKAKFLLNENNIKLVKTSCVYETNSWPNYRFPRYLNIVLKVKTNLSPLALYKKVKFIEKKIGRKNAPRNYPRKCDIDIIDFDQKVLIFNLGNEKVEIPHPRLHNRNFVLVPLFEVSRKWMHPKLNENIIKLLSKIETNSLRTIKLI